MENENKQIFTKKRFIIIIAITAALCLVIGGAVGALIWHGDKIIVQPSTTGTTAPRSDSVAMLDTGVTLNYYTTVQAAVDGAYTWAMTRSTIATDGDAPVVRLVRDVTENISVPHGLGVIFDFTGYTLDGIVSVNGILTFVGGTVGTISVDAEDAFLTVTGGMVESVGSPYENVIVTGGLFSLDFNYHWAADHGSVLKENPDPATNGTYPWLVEYDCVCVSVVGDTATPYQSVQAAVTAAGNNPAVITLHTERYEDEDISVAAGQDITLDCGYYTLHTMGHISTAGTFTFAGGTMITTGDGLNVTGGVTNIVDGTIEGVLDVTGGTVNVTGGTVVNNDWMAVVMDGGELNMTGGELCGWYALKVYENTQNVHVSGGTLRAGYAAVDGSGTPVSISGGQFVGEIVEYSDALVITGGVFSTVPAENQIASRYGVVANTDTEMVLECPYAVDFVDFVSLRLGNDEAEPAFYPSIGAALTAAGSTPAVIDVEKDTAEDITIAAGQNVTLSAIGHTLQGEITVAGTLELCEGTYIADDIALRVSGGEVTVNNADVTAGIAAVWLSSGSVTIAEGTFTSDVFGIMADTGTVTINGGDIYADGAAVAALDGAAVTVAGDKIDGRILCVGGAVTLCGGLYSDDPAEYVRLGYEILPTGDEDYPFEVSLIEVILFEQ